MIRTGKDRGKLGTRPYIADRLRGHRSSVYRALADLSYKAGERYTGKKYLFEDERGVLWVLNVDGKETGKK